MMAGSKLLPIVPALLLVFHGVHQSALADSMMLDQVLVSRQGDTATLEIRLECRDRYIDSFPLTKSERVQINLLRVDECGLSPISTPRREIQRPVGRELAALKEVEFIRSGKDKEILLLRFDYPVTVVVRQRGDLSRLLINVDISDAPSSAPDAPAPVAPVAVLPAAPIPAPESDLVARAEERARLQRPQGLAAPTTNQALYALNLESALQPIDAQRFEAGVLATDAQLYAAEVVVDGRTWYRLRLGFFTTEAEAEAALTRLRPDYPDAWVVRVPADEKNAAASNAVVAAGQDATSNSTESSSGPVAIGASSVAQAAGLTTEQLAELMDQGRQALLTSANDRAVQIYTKVLREPENEYSRQAQEYLGLARERNDQRAHAVAEYRRYLMLYPDGADAARVRQRLTGLTSIDEIRADPRMGDTRLGRR